MLLEDSFWQSKCFELVSSFFLYIFFFKFHFEIVGDINSIFSHNIVEHRLFPCGRLGEITNILRHFQGKGRQVNQRIPRAAVGSH